MICLLLIMTTIFINSTESAEQKVRHSETLLKEDMNAKTKAWLLMVESGKGDQEEFRRITPKSIFIAPLLTSRTGKCKEGYRHDHLGQCVKVIKIEPKIQLELLLQRLNKLYGEKNEEKAEEEEEVSELLEVSSGPLHFSLPISNTEEKADLNKDKKPENQTTVNSATPMAQNIPEFIPIPLPMVYLNQTKEIESSGAEPLNETETYETDKLEGSGEGQTASGDGYREEESTTLSPVSLISEETDYYEVTESESTTTTEIQTSTDRPMEDSTKSEIKDVLRESYQNITNIDSVNKNSTVSPEESIPAEEEIIVKNNQNDSEKIYFPSDGNYSNGLRTPVPAPSSRIRFPDEISQMPVPSYHSQSDLSSTPTKYQIQPSAIPREQFWWLPKNWKIDENQHKSALVKVWSRLPLIHDVSHSPDNEDGFRKSVPPNQPPPHVINPQQTDETLFINSNQHHQRVVKPFKSSRFQDIILTPRQNFRFQR